MLNWIIYVLKIVTQYVNGSFGGGRRYGLGVYGPRHENIESLRPFSKFRELLNFMYNWEGNILFMY